MALARPAFGPQLHIAPADATGSEFDRVLRISDPGPALVGALTFLPTANVAGAGWLTAWRAWEEQTLFKKLVPAMMEAAGLAARGCAREIIALDLGLVAAEGTRDAGRSLLARLAASRGERWLGKLAQSVAAEGMPGHFPTIFAVQHALFHLPLRLLVPAYAYWEWAAAMSTAPVTAGPLPVFAEQAGRLGQLAGAYLPSLSPFHAVDHLPPAAGDR